MMLPMLYKEREDVIKEFNTWITKLDGTKVKAGQVSLNEFLDEVGQDNFDAAINLFLTWWRLEGENWFSGKYGKRVGVESVDRDDSNNSGNKYLTWDKLVQAEKDLLDDMDYGINPESMGAENVVEVVVNTEADLKADLKADLNEDEVDDEVVDLEVVDLDDNKAAKDSKKDSKKGINVVRPKTTSFFSDDDDDFDF